MQSNHPIRDIALQLKALGYDPIPLRGGKHTPPRGWPTLANGPDAIARWTGQTLAVRMRGTPALTVFDLDVDDAVVRDRILGLWSDRWPAFFAAAPRRHSGRIKIAIFGRLKTERRRMQSGGWVDGNGVRHMLEIFTANDQRYVGVWGVHSPGRDYGFDGAALWQVPAAALPEFSDDELDELIALAEDAMAEAGWRQVELPRAAAADPIEVEDLTPDMVWRLEDGSELTLAAFGELFAGHPDWVTGYANIWDPHSTTANRVRGSVASGSVVLWDTKVETLHRMVRLDTAALAPLFAAVQEAAAAGAGPNLFRPLPPLPQPDPKPAPAHDATMDVKLRWLLEHYAYHESSHNAVILHEASERCQRYMQAFDLKFMAWTELGLPGPRGGANRISPTGLWRVAPQRIDVVGVQMRPDLPFPLCTIDGKLWKNTYRRARHHGEGDIAPWHAFMAHLLPDPVERAWFENWLAHKWQHPEVPGVACVMVAANANGPVYGTGRGILRDIMAALFGQSYVTTVEYDMLSGRNSQAKYTSWQAYSLMVVVNEAREESDSGRWTVQRATYERFKEIVDPRRVMRLFHVKGEKPFMGISFSTYLIATNNADALQIPADDRRFTVLSNGVRMTTDMAVLLTHWMEQPGNIAVLARYLDTRDLTGFQMHEPLRTAAKTVMQELSQTDFDLAGEAVRRRYQRHMLFTGEELLAHFMLEMPEDERRSELYRRLARQWLRRYATAVNYEQNWRMPVDPMGRRNRILRWRDYSGPPINSRRQARAAVEAARAGHGLHEVGKPGDDDEDTEPGDE